MRIEGIDSKRTPEKGGLAQLIERVLINKIFIDFVKEGAKVVAQEGIEVGFICIVLKDGSIRFSHLKRGGLTSMKEDFALERIIKPIDKEKDVEMVEYEIARRLMKGEPLDDFIDFELNFHFHPADPKDDPCSILPSYEDLIVLNNIVPTILGIGTVGEDKKRKRGKISLIFFKAKKRLLREDIGLCCTLIEESTSVKEFLEKIKGDEYLRNYLEIIYLEDKFTVNLK